MKYDHPPADGHAAPSRWPVHHLLQHVSDVSRGAKAISGPEHSRGIVRGDPRGITILEMESLETLPMPLNKPPLTQQSGIQIEHETSYRPGAGFRDGSDGMPHYGR